MGSRSIDCIVCAKSYPWLSFGNVNIPLLFSDVDAAIYDWNIRINGFTKKITEEIESLSTQLKSQSYSRQTRERLKHLLHAKKHYRQQLLDHLQCVAKFAINEAFITDSKIARNQGIDSYINNIFRDWRWNNGENEQLVDALREVVDENNAVGVCLTLGAGAARLSYDFHHQFKASHSVLVDINPVLLGYAAKIINKQPVTLYEFPVAPINLTDTAVLQECKEENLSNPEQFSFLLADGLNVPLRPKSFDTVLTPWLIDIIAVDFKSFIPHVNRVLKTGGLWINTGSLAFFHSQQQHNYCQDEVVDLLKKHGFTDVKVSRKQVNYLHSPHSAHGRVENIFSFCARKKFDCKPASEWKPLPDWAKDLNINVPKSSRTEAVSSKFLLQAQVLSAINGHRSIMEIGALLARQYQIPQDEAIAAVRKILIDNIE